ncbi:MAG: hypothetical protein HYU66_20975, partial [Armatimonadetes bacterium]|nr:hypothetical protein [Armatimonadota bacterium]
MAAEVVGAKAFFGGGALPVAAGKVADVLASLWHGAAEQAAEGELPAVTRVS